MYENFDEVELHDDKASVDRLNANPRTPSGISVRKEFLYLGIGLLGVVAIVGVSIGVVAVTNNNNNAVEVRDSQDTLETHIVPPLFRSKISEYDVEPHPNLSDSLEFIGAIPDGIRDENAGRLSNTYRNSLLLNSLEDVEDDTSSTYSPVGVCDTDECNESASTLLSAIDPSINPCENFYDYACGGWYASHPVVNESLGTFYTLDEEVAEQLLYVMKDESLVSDPLPVRDIRIYFDTCVDTDTMDRLGLTPLWNQINTAGQGGWPIAMDTWDESRYDIYDALVGIEKIGINPMISVGISSDFMNTSTNILYISEGDLGLSQEMLLDPTTYAEEIESYKQFIIDSASLCRDAIASTATDEQIMTDAQDIIDFEIKLANIFEFNAVHPYEYLEKGDIDFLQEITDAVVKNQFDWMTYFKVLFSETDITLENDQPLYIAGEPFFRNLSPLLFYTPDRTVANYIGWRWVMETGEATTYEMRNLTMDFEISVYQSSNLDDDREEHCVTQTQFNMAMPTSRAYVDMFFNTSSRPELYELVENIRTAFDSLLDENTWMAPEDIVVAKEKLAAIYDRVAYPDYIMNDAELNLAFNGLEIKEGEQFENLMRLADFYTFWNLDSFMADPVIGWPLPPTVVNAFYDPLSNSITILAAILQHPFFTSNSLAAVNYGGIGMVIGHEFTHGFDNNGRHFDDEGNLMNWWTQESIDGFNERSQCFVDQYDTYYPPELEGTGVNMSVNGEQTLGENIADNGGIREAFRAYNSYVEKYGVEPSLPGMEDFTSEQLFFLSFANLWCEHRTTDDLINQLNNDPHSPGRFRIIGSLSNDDDFWTAFNCDGTSPMNRGDEKCLLW